MGTSNWVIGEKEPADARNSREGRASWLVGSVRRVGSKVEGKRARNVAQHGFSSRMALIFISVFIPHPAAHVRKVKTIHYDMRALSYSLQVLKIQTSGGN